MEPLTIIAPDERKLIEEYRSIKAGGHGRLSVEVRDGRGQLMEATKKTILK